MQTGVLRPYNGMSCSIVVCEACGWKQEQDFESVLDKVWFLVRVLEDIKIWQLFKWKIRNLRIKIEGCALYS